MNRKVNATMLKPRVGVCGHALRVGDRVAKYRERALTSHEACHAGPYPWRYMCAACATAPTKVS